jgi:hypothetical protein
VKTPGNLGALPGDPGPAFFQEHGIDQAGHGRVDDGLGHDAFHFHSTKIRLGQQCPPPPDAGHLDGLRKLDLIL